LHQIVEIKQKFVFKNYVQFHDAGGKTLDFGLVLRLTEKLL